MEGQTAAATVSVIGGSRDRGNITLGFNVTFGNATGTCILNIYNYIYVLYVITFSSHFLPLFLPLSLSPFSFLPLLTAPDMRDSPGAKTYSVPPGVTNFTFRHSLVDDRLFEGPETFRVELFAADNVTEISGNRSALIVIEDNDSKGWRKGGKGEKGGRERRKEGGKGGGRGGRKKEYNYTVYLSYLLFFL